jgi:hypothetical protein
MTVCLKKINNLIIAVLTQNAVSSSPNIPIEEIIKHEPDIYFEYTQEDSRDLNNNTIIDKSFLNNYIPFIQSLNPKKTKQNIVTKMFIKNKIFQTIKNTIKQGKIPIAAGKINAGFKDFFKNVGQNLGLASYSKGGVYFTFNVNNQDFIFINMHLPIKTHDKVSFGNEYRKESMIQIIKKLKEKKLIDNNTFVFIAGDLNFRIFPDPTSGNLEDQLTKILSNPDEELKGITELEFKDPKDKIFTCKFDNKLNNNNFATLDECRNQPIPDNMDENMGNIKKIQDSCGDPGRFPSRCDRSLLKIPMNNNINVEVLENKGKYLQNMKSIRDNINIDENTNAEKNDDNVSENDINVEIIEENKSSVNSINKETLSEEIVDETKLIDSDHNALLSVIKIDFPTKGGGIKKRTTRKNKKSKSKKRKGKLKTCKK